MWCLLWVFGEVWYKTQACILNHPYDSIKIISAVMWVFLIVFVEVLLFVESDIEK